MTVYAYLKEGTMQTYYVVLASGYDEPEMVGPFDNEDTASEWAARKVLEPWWVVNLAQATSPDSSAWDDPE